MPNSDLRTYLSLLQYPVEQRIVKSKWGTISGYFDDPDKLAEACEYWSGKVEAVYTTLNPVKPDLLARSYNRWASRAKATTTDNDIAQRLWLPLDCDPIRPAGISSTDEEHQAALKRMAEIYKALTAFGFPAGLFASSGNGAHLLFRIDQPNTPEVTQAIQALLAALAEQFDDDVVKVDRGVFNPARIWKVYGTQCRKGDEVAGRKYRFATIIDQPAVFDVVSLELIQSYTAQYAKAQPGTAQPNARKAGVGQAPPDADGFDKSVEWVDTFIDRHGIEVRSEKIDAQGRQVRRLVTCPLCGESDKSAVIIIGPEGKLGFKCQHNRCTDKHWPDFRRHFDPEYKAGSDDPSPTKKAADQTSLLVSLATKHATLFHTPNDDAYASMQVAQHVENWPIRSTPFTHWLTGLFFDCKGGAPDNEAVDKACTILEILACRSFCFPVHQRTVRSAETIYIDLGDREWRAIEVDRTGWRIVDNPPVKFRRTKNTGQLPVPTQDGSLDELRALSATSEEGYSLFLGCLLDALKGHGPYLIPILTGEAGSAKSTLARLFRWLVDPLRRAELSSLPRDEGALGADCRNEFLLCYDNVSYLGPWLSDALCMVSTGAGFKTRKLYTDGDQSIIDACSPIVLNGIPDFATAGDLLDRGVLIRQPAIVESKRLTKNEVEGRFNAAKGRIYGALLTLLSRGLKNEPTVSLASLPRMADSIRWVVACLGDDEFSKAYAANRREAVEIGLESSPVSEVLRAILKLNSICERVGYWEGTANRLLDLLCNHATHEQRSGKLWPASPKALSNTLRRDAPALRQVGVDVNWKRSHGRNNIVIQPTKVSRPVDELGSEPKEPEHNPACEASGVAGVCSDEPNADSGDFENGCIIRPIPPDCRRYRGGYQGQDPMIPPTMYKEFESRSEAVFWVNQFTTRGEASRAAHSNAG